MEKNKETHMINKINIEIQVPEDFPDNYKNAVIKSAGLCAVKKHLEKPPRTDIYVKSGN
jgi:ribosomal protein S12 methylthiotransferase accessory factor